MKNQSDTLDDFTRQFLRFEEELSTFDLALKGVPIWERIRKKVYDNLRKAITNLDSDSNTTKKNYKKTFRGGMLWLKNLFVKNPYFANQHDYLFWGHQRRKLLGDGLWWDIYCDPIYEGLNLDALHLEVAHNARHFKPTKTSNIRYLDFPVFSGTIVREIVGDCYYISKSSRKKIECWEGEIAERFGTKIDLVHIIKKVLLQRRVRKYLYEYLLSRIQPRVVFLTVSYHRETFIEVCQELNIPVIELQHGRIGPDHMGYSFPGSRTKVAFPDHLFLFGDYWNEVAEYPIPDENLHTVGYPHLERQKKKYSDIDRSEQVLFISQPQIGDKLASLAIDFNEIIPDYDVVFKLHPHEYDNWPNRYPELMESDLSIVTEDLPLYKLLSQSSVQVGYNSTVLYEGLSFNLDTYILDFHGYNRTSQLSDIQGIDLISSAKELADQLSRDSRPSTDPERFFAGGSIDRFRNTLNSILEN